MHMCLRARQRQQIDRASRAGAAQSSAGRPCGRRADRWKAACATEVVSQAHAQEQTLLVACLQLSVHRLNARRSRPSVAHAANEVSAHAREQTQLVSVSGAERTVRRSQLGRQFRF